MRRGQLAANRKPIAGAKTVKVVVVVRRYYYLPGKELVNAIRQPGASYHGQ
jgi:hypothetical protein